MMEWMTPDGYLFLLLLAENVTSILRFLF